MLTAGPTARIASDHSILLIDRRTFDLNWDPELKEFLVIVEEKVTDLDIPVFESGELYR
jgi:hypothetical protein